MDEYSGIVSTTDLPNQDKEDCEMKNISHHPHTELVESFEDDHQDFVEVDCGKRKRGKPKGNLERLRIVAIPFGVEKLYPRMLPQYKQEYGLGKVNNGKDVYVNRKMSEAQFDKCIRSLVPALGNNPFRLCRAGYNTNILEEIQSRSPATLKEGGLHKSALYIQPLQQLPKLDSWKDPTKDDDEHGLPSDNSREADHQDSVKGKRGRRPAGVIRLRRIVAVPFGIEKLLPSKLVHYKKMYGLGKANNGQEIHLDRNMSEAKFDEFIRSLFPALSNYPYRLCRSGYNTNILEDIPSRCPATLIKGGLHKSGLYVQPLQPLPQLKTQKDAYEDADWSDADDTVRDSSMETDVDDTGTEDSRYVGIPMAAIPHDIDRLGDDKLWKEYKEVYGLGKVYDGNPVVIKRGLSEVQFDTFIRKLFPALGDHPYRLRREVDNTGILEEIQDGSPGTVADNLHKSALYIQPLQPLPKPKDKANEEIDDDDISESDKEDTPSFEDDSSWSGDRNKDDSPERKSKNLRIIAIPHGLEQIPGGCMNKKCLIYKRVYGLGKANHGRPVPFQCGESEAQFDTLVRKLFPTLADHPYRLCRAARPTGVLREVRLLHTLKDRTHRDSALYVQPLQDLPKLEEYEEEDVRKSEPGMKGRKEYDLRICAVPYGVQRMLPSEISALFMRYKRLYGLGKANNGKPVTISRKTSEAQFDVLIRSLFPALADHPYRLCKIQNHSTESQLNTLEEIQTCNPATLKATLNRSALYIQPLQPLPKLEQPDASSESTSLDPRRRSHARFKITAVPFGVEKMKAGPFLLPDIVQYEKLYGLGRANKGKPMFIRRKMSAPKFDMFIRRLFPALGNTRYRLCRAVQHTNTLEEIQGDHPKALAQNLNRSTLYVQPLEPLPIKTSQKPSSRLINKDKSHAAVNVEKPIISPGASTTAEPLASTTTTVALKNPDTGTTEGPSSPESETAEVNPGEPVDVTAEESLSSETVTSGELSGQEEGMKKGLRDIAPSPQEELHQVKQKLKIDEWYDWVIAGDLDRHLQATMLLETYLKKIQDNITHLLKTEAVDTTLQEYQSVELTMDSDDAMEEEDDVPIDRQPALKECRVLLTDIRKSHQPEDSLDDPEEVENGDPTYEEILCDLDSEEDEKPKVKRKPGRPRNEEDCERSFQCSVCAKMLANLHTLRAHEKTHLPKEDHPCTHCDKVFQTLAGLKAHILHKHTEDTNLIKCSYCSYATRSQSSMDYHYQSRHDPNRPRPHVCDICQKGFFTNNALRVHWTGHSKDKKFSCELCDHKTNTESLLNSHMRNVHSGKSGYTCKVCGVNIKYKGSLKSHMARHMGDLQFKCDVCGKGFYTSSALATHKTMHEPKKFSCQVCGKLFPDRTHLNVHMGTHTGEKKHGCPHCSYRCVTRSNLKKHTRAVHGVELPWLGHARVAPPRSPTHSNTNLQEPSTALSTGNELERTSVNDTVQLIEQFNIPGNLSFL